MHNKAPKFGWAGGPMKSGKQRRTELKAERSKKKAKKCSLKGVEKREEIPSGITPCNPGYTAARKASRELPVPARAAPGQSRRRRRGKRQDRQELR